MNAIRLIVPLATIAIIQFFFPDLAFANRSPHPDFFQKCQEILDPTLSIEPTIENFRQLKAMNKAAYEKRTSVKRELDALSKLHFIKRRNLESELTGVQQRINDSSLALIEVMEAFARKMSDESNIETTQNLIARLPTLGKFGSSPNRLADMIHLSEFGIEVGWGQNSINLKLIREIALSLQPFHIMNRAQGGYFITVRLDTHFGFNWNSAYSVTEEKLYEFLGTLK